jgi:integrase
MPLYLRAPRKGKSPNFEIRGTYLGVSVEQSSGTDRRSVAVQQLRKLERAIEAGEYPPVAPVARSNEPTFLSAALAYMEAGGERKYAAPLIKHFAETPLSQIDQAAIEQAATTLRPNATGATRNRCVYTPVSAILHHAGISLQVRRPKGAKGKVRTDFLSEMDAKAILAAADPDLAVLLTFLIYTGCRLGEALALTWDDIDLQERRGWVRDTKNGDPRTLLLRQDLCAILAPHKGTGRVFKFHQGGHLKWMLRRATLKACGISAPERRPNDYKVAPHRLRWVNFHSMRHTFASWFRRAGGDVQGLVATGNWRDPRSAARYAHVIARDEWARVEKLPKVSGE